MMNSTGASDRSEIATNCRRQREWRADMASRDGLPNWRPLGLVLDSDSVGEKLLDGSLFETELA
jgi:hypothetical protein